MSESTIGDCDHQYDGGQCMDCGELQLCELCDTNSWETRCDICDSGKICTDCYHICEICGNKVCIPCGNCDNAECTRVSPNTQVSDNKKIHLINSEYSWKNMSLLEYLDEGNYPDDWGDFFTQKNIQAILKSVSEELDTERGKTIIYPPIYQVFRAFYMTPLSKIKTVILGQDPYHNGSAVGLCFSVKPGNQINPSLKNIYRELKNEGFSPEETGDLAKWARQGVLLINSALTVASGSPESHLCYWADFTRELILFIDKSLGSKVKWLLFGKPAFTSVTKLLGRKDNMLVSTHPSPLGASKNASFGPAFLGSGIFKGVPEIKW